MMPLHKQKPEPVKQDWLRSVVELVGIISLPAAVLGVFGAFLGWIKQINYLNSLGVHPSWVQADLIQLVLIGWSDIRYILLFLLLLAVIRVITIRVVGIMGKRLTIAVAVALLVVIFVLGLIAILRFFQGDRFYDFVLRNGLLIIAIWITINIATELAQEKTQLKTSLPRWLQGFISFTSDRQVLLATLVGILLMYFTLFAAYRGLYRARIDRENPDNFRTISFVSNLPLDVASGYGTSAHRVEGEKYSYQGFKFIERSADFVFLFRPEEIDPITGDLKVYVIPMRNIEFLKSD